MRLRDAGWIAVFAAARAWGDSNPPPSQPLNAVNPPYAAATLNDPFPDSIYGADHGGSSVAISFPFVSPFGNTDHSRGVITYSCLPFSPRGSEGVYGIDVWLEQEDSFGNWAPAALNGGLADGQASPYQAVNTPNPGPSPAYTFTWTFDQTQLPPNVEFRVFSYVYLYNQGGGSQGNFYAASTVGPVNSGAANDPPRIAWTAPFAEINPSQAQAGQSYTISADAEDDNGNLATVSINKNGLPFAYAGGGNGFGGNSQNPSTDSPGTDTYTAWAADSFGAASPLISWTVTVSKASQAPVSSANTALPYYSSPFTPSEEGGSGTGPWQFVIGGYTNWTSGNDGNSGTELSPGNTWSPSWMPPAPGSYTFWVEKDADSNFNPSGPSAAYTLTVTPASPVGSFDGISATSLVRGQSLAGSGWAADAQSGAPLSQVQILIDNGASGSVFASLGGSRPDVQSANTSWGHWSPRDLTASGWSFSLATTSLAPGAHSLTAVASDATYGVSAPIGSQNFSVTSASPPSVSISAPASGTIGSPLSLSATATAGTNPLQTVILYDSWTGFGPGGAELAATPTPSNPSATVGNPFTPGQTGTLYLTATASDTQGAGATAYASVQIGSDAASFSAAPLAFTYNGAIQGPALSSSPAAVMAGGYYSVSGTRSATNAGAYAFTATATGIYTGADAFPWSISPASQAAVTVSPPSASLSPGESVTFTASGGSGTGAFNWSGAASGAGTTATVSFPSSGAYTVTVTKAGDGNYEPSNPASASVSVGGASATFSAAPLAFTYNGSNQGPLLSSSPAAVVTGGSYSISGMTSAVNAGSYAFTASATGSYSGSATFSWQINPAAQAAIAISPASASIRPGQSVTFTASGGSGTGAFSWSGAAGGSGPTETVIFPGSGTYTVNVTRSGDSNYLPSATATAAVDVSSSGLQSQTISFSPPPLAVYPGPNLALSATATSGLTVVFSLLGGPALLHHTTLVFTGIGAVSVQANQPGNGQWAAAPPVNATIQVNPPAAVARFRFNLDGVDGLVTPRAESGGASLIWSDPTGLQTSPWPNLGNPPAAAPVLGNFPLPAPPGPP